MAERRDPPPADAEVTPARRASLDDIIAVASPAERLVPVCVAGSLVAEHQQLERDLEAAQRADLTAPRLGSSSSAHTVAERIRDVQQRMREHTYLFRFRAVSPERWSNLLAEHADPAGKRAFNPDTFPLAAIAACCVEPDGMGDVERVRKLMDRLSPAQHSELFDGAWDVNTTAPKELTSYAASAVLRVSAPSSDTAPPSASPAPSS